MRKDYRIFWVMGEDTRSKRKSQSCRRKSYPIRIKHHAGAIHKGKRNFEEGCQGELQDQNRFYKYHIKTRRKNCNRIKQMGGASPR